MVSVSSGFGGIGGGDLMYLALAKEEEKRKR
jgi:hypothetical protein